MQHARISTEISRFLVILLDMVFYRVRISLSSVTPKSTPQFLRHT